jgi:ABC-type protease/lipase transport system fused ATPase/permease subunit
MQTKFLIFMAIVFIVTIIFGVLIWRQTLVFEKKALAAKQRKEAYLKQLEQEEQERQAAAEAEKKAAEIEAGPQEEENTPVS